MSPGDYADAEFLRIMKSLLRSPGLVDVFEGLNPLTYQQVTVGQQPGLPPAFPFTPDDQTALTFANAVRLLKVLSRIPSKEVASSIGISIIANLIVAICKQGTVSGQFIDKIKGAIMQDIGRSVALKENLISSIWGAYGQYINETIVGPLMDHFLMHIMGE